MNPRCKVLTTWDEEYARPVWRDTLSQADLTDVRRLSDRAIGQVVTDCRTSWVRRHRIGVLDFHIKTYDYPTRRDRRRGWFRTTWMAPSRAAREHQALRWLLGQGFAAPEPILRIEVRRRGQLRRACLVTATWPGESLAQFADPLPTDLVDAVRQEVDRLHRAGFRDGNLDRRNVLVRRAGGQGEGARSGWEVAFLDSPKFHLRSPTTGPGRPDDSACRRDRERLAL